MNKIFKFSIIIMSLLAFAVTFNSCSSDDDNTVQAVNFTVSVKMPEGIKSDVAYSGQTVNLIQGTQVKYSAETNEAGVATFTGVIPDVYDISTSWEIDGQTYTTIAEADVENVSVVVGGNLLSQAVTNSVSDISLSTVLNVKQSILISKIFYAGRKNDNNKNYIADQYIELFNNSDEEITLDGLYIGILESESTAAYPANNNSDYLYTKQVFRIPGEGSQYKLAAGSTILIVNSAIDHRSTASTSNDLSNATFEAKNTKNNNNPATPGLTLIYTAYATIPSINFLAGGDFGVILFNTDEDVTQWENVYAPGKTTGNIFKKIPANTVIDGVEALKNKTTGVDINAKRLYNFIDAGYQFISATTGYTGETLIRKTEKEENGRVYLIDTNNSTNDFSISTDIKPGTFLSK